MPDKLFGAGTCWEASRAERGYIALELRASFFFSLFPPLNVWRFGVFCWCKYKIGDKMMKYWVCI